MQPYQEEYIENCRKFRSIASAAIPRCENIDALLEGQLENTREAQRLTERNTLIIQKKLMPVLDKIHAQDKETLDGLESFADALTAAPLALDTALACRIHEFLLSCYRHLGQRENIIRELYKLGMSRYGMFVMMTALELPETDGFSSRMKYCFVEASSYIKYFEEFGEETKSFILRSLANTYLGNFSDWTEKFYRVKRTMQVFNDKKYQSAAPGLPWELYIFTVHRQMASVLPYSFPKGPPSPEIVTDVLESAHIIFEKQFELAEKNGEPIDAHRLMPYYSVQYTCGIIRREELLAKMEELMDAGDTSVYDEKNGYRIISMPAYYVQYLRMMPELVPPREEYIAGLYRRMMSYIHSIPSDKITDATKLSIRYNLASFYEAKNGISYKEMALEIMKRFAPELYVHGYTVGRMAQVMCGFILENEPEHFDDIPGIAALSSKEEKRRAMEEMSLSAGLLHDIGKLYFTTLYNHTGRHMLANEEEVLELHALVGYTRLSEHESCTDYADAAYGHHGWYDGADGYPAGFVRKKSRYRALVDLISFANYLDCEDDGNTAILPLRTVSFEDKIHEAKKLEGRRFSPLITGWLRETKLLEQLDGLYINGHREGLEKLLQ